MRERGGPAPTVITFNSSVDQHPPSRARHARVPCLSMMGEGVEDLDIPGTVNWVRDLGLKRIALQLPDELMHTV